MPNTTFTGAVTKPKGSIKKKKMQQKEKERLGKSMQELNDLIGKLDDRDTQQHAFTSLMYAFPGESLPQLNASILSDFYSLIEKNKNPTRCSTRRMLVLVLGALCKCHPTFVKKNLPRVLAYNSHRLRDKEVQVTDACVILIAAITLHVLPHAAKDFSSAGNAVTNWEQVFERVASPLLKEINAVGEAATKCLCGMIRPVEFDGVSYPREETLLAHARRIAPFFKSFVGECVAKMDGSTMYASFSSVFLLLHAACHIARDAKEKVDYNELYDYMSPHVSSIYEAIEDVFRYAPRDDWILRKRGVELLTLLLETFALGDEAKDIMPKSFFRDHLERIRSLMLAGRHDPVSAVRDAAIQSVLAFEKLEKQYPDVAASRKNKTKPFTSEAARANYASRCGTASPSFSKVQASKKEQGTGMSHGSLDLAEMTELDEVPFAPSSGDELFPVANAMDLQDFGDTTMDEAKAPDSQPDDADTNSTAFVEGNNERQEQKSILTAVSPLKKFMAKQREAKQLQQIPHISPPKLLKTRDNIPAHFPNISKEDDDEETSNEDKEEQDNDSSDQHPPITRAEAALEAAECKEYDLAIRLCLLEDDMELLKQTMGVIGRPCMNKVSRATRNALCAAFLDLLYDDSVKEQSSLSRGRLTHHSINQWLVFQWLHSLSASSCQQIDRRISEALSERLMELSLAPTKAGLAAAQILTHLGW